MYYVSPLSKIHERIKRYTSPTTRRNLTQAERETIPYVRAEQAKRERKRNWLKPIEAIFDLLQRGQYVTANTAEQIIRNLREGEPALKGVAREAWEGLTGKEKGDWENVLFGGKDVGGEEFEGLFKDIDKERWEKPVLGKWAKGKPIIGATGRGLAGLAANIFLDPTTYIGFGPTTAARAAATKYADDVARLTIKQFVKNPETLAKLARKGGSELAERIERLAIKNPQEALRLLQKNVGIDISQHMAKVAKAAKKEALRLPEKELREKALGRITEARIVPAKKVQEGIQRQIRNLAKEYADYGPAKGLSDLINEHVAGYVSKKEAVTGLKYLDELAESVQKGAYAGAGTRAARFMRKEFAISERYPEILKAWDNLGKWWTEKSKIGGYFSDAWWAMMNKGVVGKLKKMFNIRNPYQEILARTVQDAKAATTDTIARTQQGLVDLLKPLDENSMRAVRELLITAQGEAVDFRKMALEMGVATDKIDLVVETVASINNLTAMWRKRLEELVQDGIIKEVGEIENYLPVRRTGTGFYKKAPTPITARHPGFLFARTAGFEENIASEAAKLKFIFPEISDEAAQSLVREGAGDLQTDLYQMLLGRGMAQARLEQRASIIKQIREMGFNLKQAAEMDDELAQIMVNNQTVLQQFGLQAIPDDALEGYLFDKETSEILGKAIKITASDETLRTAAQWIGSFTAWWKAWATASPGFHWRNHYSNNVTGILKHGAEWFNPRNNFEAWAGTIAGLERKNAFKKLVAEGVDEAMATGILSRIYGGKSLEELAAYATRKGVIARHVMGFDAPKTLEGVLKQGDAFKKINPMSKEFGLLQGSYALSMYVENTARFHSFMLDYKRALKQGSAPETAMEYASLQAKKWFLDYDDLSPFEQKVMKSIIPFYCVPTDAEILTREGWKTNTQLRKGEDVLAYDVKTDTAFWYPLKNVAVFNYDGILMSIKNRTNGEYLFTPNHKWPVFVAQNYATGINRKIVRGYELRSGYRIPLTAAQTQWPQKCSISVREAKIIGWVLTDGSIKQKTKNFYQYVIYQADHKFAEEIRELLNGECSEYVHPLTRVRRFELNGNLRKRIQSLITSKTNNELLITSLSKECAEAMWDAMYKADGTIVRERKTRPGVMTDLFFAAKRSTPNGKAVGDYFQILSIMLNKVAHMTKDGKGMYIRKNSVRRFIKIGKDNNALGTEWYKGEIWCPEIDGLCWMLRRNGKHIWSSNTWIRKNLANQIQGMFDFREMYSMIPKLSKGAPGVEKSEMPNWMRDLGYIPFEVEEGEAKMFWPNTPYMDVNKIPLKFEMSAGGIPVPKWGGDEILRDVVSNAHPLIKTAVEMVGRRDVFKDTPLDDNLASPRLMRILAGKDGDARILTWLDGFLRLAGWERGLDPDVNEEGQLTLNPLVVRALENNILFLKRIPQYFDLPEAVFPALQEVKNKAGAVGDYEKADEQLEEIFQILSFYLGVKMKTLDVEEQRQYEARDVLKTAEEERYKQMKRLPGYSKRKAEYIKRSIKRQKRLGL